jgi:hypothetical protein
VLFRAKFGDGPRTSGALFSEERAGEFTAAASLAGSGRQHGLGHGGLTCSLLIIKLLRRRLIAQIKVLNKLYILCALFDAYLASRVHVFNSIFRVTIGSVCN